MAILSSSWTAAARPSRPASGCYTSRRVTPDDLPVTRAKRGSSEEDEMSHEHVHVHADFASGQEREEHGEVGSFASGLAQHDHSAEQGGFAVGQEHAHAAEIGDFAIGQEQGL